MSDALPSILETIEIAADSQQVWRVLTDEDSTPAWLGCMRYKSQVGAIFYMQPDQAKAKAGDVSGATHCEILALEPSALFKFSWFLPGMAPTFVSIRLEATGPRATRVVLEHEGWDKFPADQIKPIRDMLVGGWKSFVLPNLRRACEG